MAFLGFVLTACMVALSLAAVAPWPEQIEDQNNSATFIPGSEIDDSRKLTEADKEMIEVFRSLDKMADDLTPAQRDFLDDLIEDGVEDDECDKPSEDSRVKRACNKSCHVSCSGDIDYCKIDGCCRRAKCKCSFWRRNAKCNCK